MFPWKLKMNMVDSEFCAQRGHVVLSVQDDNASDARLIRFQFFVCTPRTCKSYTECMKALDNIIVK